MIGFAATAGSCGGRTEGRDEWGFEGNEDIDLGVLHRIHVQPAEY